MFIRRTQTRRTQQGETYYTHRLVRSVRINDKVRQRTLLNLGRHFEINKTAWPELCRRIEEVLSGQSGLFREYAEDIETEAQRIVAQLLAREATPADDSAPSKDLQTVDVDSLELVRPRSVGVEEVGLWALQQLGLSTLLKDLGMNGALRAAALGSIVGRMAFPASERATYQWLSQQSALGELLDVDFETMSAMQLYRASDALMAHREAIEAHLFERSMGLFDLHPTVTLYDLTNTYFEGEAQGQTQAVRGHSKEKRSDCPLLTLGLVLDASGFVRRSQVFAGNVREDRTLAPMLSALDAPCGALVVMDRGIATEEQVQWLRDHGYRYLVVSRAGHRQFDEQTAVTIQTRNDQQILLHKVVSREADEVRLYCYSEERKKKERGIQERFEKRLEAALGKLNEGLSRPRTHKKLDQVWDRIGRIKEKSHGISQHYDINVVADETGTIATQVTWSRQPVDGSRVTHPGVYCLRSNETEWDEETLWRTYNTLTEIESVFRSLKSELGLRPIYHHKPVRAEGHLLITVIAYQLVQVIRSRLRVSSFNAEPDKELECQASWTTLRRILSGRQRVTATFRCADGRTLHVRKATQAEPIQQTIYDALGMDHSAGGIKKTYI